MIGRAARAPAVVMVLLLAPIAVAAGDARDSYRDGLDALRDGRFQAAEKAFRDAIAERGEEKKAGAFRGDYLPHYHLGVALDEQHRCREALAAWQESERQGEIRKAREDHTQLMRRKQVCEAKVRELDAARAAAEQAVARARKADQAAARLQGKSDVAALWNDGEPSLASRQKDARQRLEQTVQRLAATADPHGVAPLQEVKTLANQVASDFDAVASDAEQRLVALQSAAASALDRLQAVEQRAHAELGAVAYLDPYPPELGRRVETLRGALRAVVDAKATASPPQLDALRQQLDGAMGRLRQAAAPPPASLRTAVAAFLGGDYESALAALEGETYKETRAVSQACLLRAASRHALWELGGESDAELAAALAADVAECRGLKTPPAVSTRFYSPRFVRFFEKAPALVPVPPPSE